MSAARPSATRSPAAVGDRPSPADGGGSSCAWPSWPPATATRSRRHAGDTIAAGGKRLRPLLVFLAAGDAPPETDALVRAAVAVELVHSATLVHDDVLDGSDLRRGRPTVVATGGRRWPRRPATCCSPGRSPSSRGAGSRRRGPRPLAGQLGAGRRRADAARRRVDGGVPRRSLPRSLPAEDRGLFSAACELGAIDGRGRIRRRAGRLRRADRAGLPAARRRARRDRARPSAPASRAAPTCSTAR